MPRNGTKGNTLPANRKKKGIYREWTDTSKPPSDETRVAEFAYQNDALAEMIVRAWTDGAFKTTILADPQQALADRGIHLKNPTVITEGDYYNGYVAGDTAEVVFVLPDADRVDMTAGTALLEAAKLLMACTPNGI
jgi:hypothetical protein